MLCVAYRHEYSTYTYYRHHNILLMSIHGSNTDVRKMITVTMLAHKLYQVRLCWLIRLRKRLLFIAVQTCLQPSLL